MMKGGGEIRWAAVFIVATVLSLVLVPGPAGNDRFRLPAEPFLCVLAGVGSDLLAGWLKHPRPETGD